MRPPSLGGGPALPSLRRDVGIRCIIYSNDEFFVTFQVLSSQTFKLLPSLQMTTYDLARVGDAGADASGRNAGFRKKG